MPNAEFKVLLTIDSQGNAKIEEVKRGLQETGAASEESNKRGAAAAENYAATLAKQLGIYALITAGIYKVEQSIVGTFKSGIRVVDDYHVSVIGIAATLTDLSKPGQGDMTDVFRRNKAQAEDMWRSITIESAKHFATAGEGMMVYNRLVQSGYATRLDEVNALLTLTDKIKLATRGQNVEMQLNTEIIALMNGQARAQSMLALELSQRLGPGWGDLVQKHKQAGDLVSWIASLYPGLGVANKEIEGTINAQFATTKSLLELLAIGGLGGAYENIVGWNKEINDYLRTHQELAGKIERTWQNISPAVEGIAGFIGKGTLALVDFGAKLDEIAQNPVIMILAGAAAGSRFGPWGAVVGGITGGFTATEFIKRSYQNREKARQEAMSGVGPSGEAAESFFGPLPKGAPPAIKPPPAGDTGTGGGRSLESAQRQLENFVNRMQAETAKAAGASFGALNAWYDKESLALARLEAQVGDSFTARAEMRAAYNSKYEKLVDDLAKKETKSFLENAKKQEKSWLDSLNLQKDVFGQLAAISPVLTDQLGFREKALNLEIEINQAVFERKLMELEKAHIIEKSLGDELRGYQALEAQLKRNALSREGWATEGTGGGLRMWAFDRSRERETRGATMARQGMLDIERQFSSAVSRGIVGALKGERANFSEIGWGIAESFIQRATDRLAAGAFDFLANIFLQGSSSLNVSSDNLMNVFDGAASGLSEVSDQFGGMFSEATGGLLNVIMSIGSSFLGFLGFHSGGMVAHQGLIVAHNGWPLASDERLILAQTGEGVLPRPSMARLGPQRFEALRSGNFAVGAAGGGGVPAQVRLTVPIRVVYPDGKTLLETNETVVWDIANKGLEYKEIIVKAPARRR